MQACKGNEERTGFGLPVEATSFLEKARDNPEIGILQVRGLLVVGFRVQSFGLMGFGVMLHIAQGAGLRRGLGVGCWNDSRVCGFRFSM